MQDQAIQDFFQAYAKRPYKTEAARKRAITRDLRTTDRVVKSTHAPSYAAWKREPWKYDLPHVDTKGSEKNTRKSIYRLWLQHLTSHPEHKNAESLSRLQSDLKKAHEQNLRQLKEITFLSNQLQNLAHPEQLERVERARQECLIEKSKLESDIADLNQAMVDCQREKQRFSQDTAEMKEKIGQLNQAVIDFQREREECLQERNQLQREIDELSQMIAIIPDDDQEESVLERAERERREREEEDRLEEERRRARLEEIKRKAEEQIEKDRIAFLEARQEKLRARRKEIEEKYKTQTK